MKRILILHSHTLHTKVSIPLAIELIKNGFHVSYLKNRPDFLRFGIRQIISNPTSVDFINRNALGYVARQINYHDEFDRVSEHISTVFRPDYKKYDAVISSTKDASRLKEIAHKFCKPAFALGYQHLPVFMRMDKTFSSPVSNHKSALFFQQNAFTSDHDFAGLLNHGSGLTLNNFTFLDRVYSLYKTVDRIDKDTSVLIFHPGGYRRVLTEPGASKETSYARQREFIAKIALPLLEAGLKPVIKTHPLPARFHTIDDMKIIVSEIEQKHSLVSGSITVTDEWFWHYAYNAAFSITFGSSSIYELWAAGIQNVYVCNFLGQDRSRRFSYFPGIYINTYEEFLNFIRNRNFDSPSFDDFTRQVMAAYASLFNDGTARRIAEIIKNELA
jgi:hypothetical protein